MKKENPRINHWLSNFFGIKIYESESLDVVNYNEISEKHLFMFKLNNKLDFPSQDMILIEKTLVLEKNIENLEYSNKFEYISSLKHNYDVTEDDFDIFCNYSRFRIFEIDLVKKFYHEWFSNSINGLFDNIFGFVKNEKLLGFCTYRFTNNNLEIGLIGVFKGYQNQNVGSELIKYAIYTALKFGLKRIILRTQSENLKAIKFYTNNGFRIINHHYWYYGGNFFDTIQ